MCATDPEHLYRIYSIPTHDKHQWLLLQFIVFLMMEARGVQNMYSILVVVNKHNTARVASCWFIIYYTPLFNLIFHNIFYMYMFRTREPGGTILVYIYRTVPVLVTTVSLKMKSSGSKHVHVEDIVKF